MFLVCLETFGAKILKKNIIFFILPLKFLSKLVKNHETISLNFKKLLSMTLEGQTSNYDSLYNVSIFTKV